MSGDTGPEQAGRFWKGTELRACGLTRDQLVAALLAGDPAVAVGVIDSDCIALNPQTLEPGEAELVLAAVRRALA